MIVSLQTHRLETLDDVRGFVAGSEAAEIVAVDRESAYGFARETLVRFRYRWLSKSEKGVILRYLSKVTGKSPPQIQRLVRQHRETGRIVDRRGPPKNAFERRYTKADIGLRAEVDAALGQMCGHSYARGDAADVRGVRRPALRASDRDLERALLQPAQLDRLPAPPHGTVFKKTRASTVAIGERRKPTPEGRPGFLRVDTVHQGDRDGEKGVYHINLVDEVTQWEHAGTVRAISENCLLRVLEELIASCPFKVLGFHADNGSEYINRRVAEMLSRLHVPEFTKSCSRHTNDNALVESKNGNVIRRQFGYGHIPKLFARECNAFARDVLNPYLNFHRPCLFPTEVVDQNGRRRKRYRYQDVMTPFEKLKSLPNVERYLRPSVAIAALEEEARAMSDLDAARAVNRARAKLFKLIHRESSPRRRSA